MEPSDRCRLKPNRANSEILSLIDLDPRSKLVKSLAPHRDLLAKPMLSLESQALTISSSPCPRLADGLLLPFLDPDCALLRNAKLTQPLDKTYSTHGPSLTILPRINSDLLASDQDNQISAKDPFNFVYDKPLCDMTTPLEKVAPRSTSVFNMLRVLFLGLVLITEKNKVRWIDQIAGHCRNA